MIGIETINTIQFIAMFQIFAIDYESTVSAMRGLINSLGGMQNRISNGTIVASRTYEERLNYSESFIGNNELILYIQGISVIIYLVIISLQNISLF